MEADPFFFLNDLTDCPPVIPIRNAYPTIFANGLADVQLLGENCIKLTYFQHDFGGACRFPLTTKNCGELILPLQSIGHTRALFTRKIWALGLNPDGSRRR
jgi:hypothetical protein